MGEENKLHETVTNYLHKLESLHEVVPLSLGMAHMSGRTSNAKKNKFLEENGELIDVNDNEKNYKLNLEHRKLYERLDKKVSRFLTALSVLPGKFLVAFVSEYDAFLGNLVKDIFRLKPEFLDNSDRSLSFSELKSMGSVEVAYEYILEKEVETLLRKSHSEQFDWLEKKFGLGLKKGLDSWPLFIEITERRNLLVHCDGIVSNQYLAVCRKHGVQLDDEIKVGTQLVTDREYLAKAYRCLYEIGVKLTQVLWRKVFKNEIQKADMSLMEISYNLIHDEELELSKRLLDFSTCTLKSWGDDSSRRAFVINRAQSYYHAGDYQDCLDILGNEDWTACSDRFQICVASLQRDYQKAKNIMERIGGNGSVLEADYLDWPVFKDFRGTDEFKQAFQNVFKKDPAGNVSSFLEEPSIFDVLDDKEIEIIKGEILGTVKNEEANLP